MYIYLFRLFALIFCTKFLALRTLRVTYLLACCSAGSGYNGNGCGGQKLCVVCKIAPNVLWCSTHNFPH